MRIGVLVSLADWLLDKGGGNAPYSAGRRYVDIGRPDAAEVAFGDAQQLYGAISGQRTRMLASRQSVVRGAALGSHAEAATLYEKALAVAELSPGRDSERYASLRDRLAEARRALQQLVARPGSHGRAPPCFAFSPPGNPTLRSTRPLARPGAWPTAWSRRRCSRSPLRPAPGGG